MIVYAAPSAPLLFASNPASCCAFEIYPPSNFGKLAYPGLNGVSTPLSVKEKDYRSGDQ